MTAKDSLRKLLEQKGKAQFLNRAYSVIQEAAFDMNPELVLSQSFSPQAIEEVLPIVAEYEQEIESLNKLEDAICNEIYERTCYFDDEALNEVSAYAVVYGDRIEFVAHENGYGDRLPKKNRKYIGSQGDRRWRFPVSMLSEIRPLASFVINEDGSLNK